MVSKRKKYPSLQEKLERPWCYYCEREFEDLKILIQHQKAKHFKCERCNRRLNTAGGLSVHMNQVHKETLTSVDNANPGRQGLDVEIFGMEGIPTDIVEAHNQQVMQAHFAEEQERARTTGNPVGGTGNTGEPGQKKPKLEKGNDLKKRLAEHRAKKASMAASGGGSGNATPMSTEGQSPAVSQSPFAPPAGSPPYGQQQPAFSASQHSPPPGATQAFGQPPFSPAQFGQPQPAPTYGAPGPYPPPGGPFGQQYPAGGQPYFQNGPPPHFGANSPPAAFPYSQPPGHGPPMNGSAPPRQGSIPSSTGLPQRPAFGGSVNPPQTQQGYDGLGRSGLQSHGREQDMSSSAIAASVDDLISDITKAGMPTDATTADPAQSAAPSAKAKKEKGNTRLLFNEEKVSPEETLALFSRHAFKFEDKESETVMRIPEEGAVTGTVDAA